jgi:hypothetical protein
MSDTKILIGGQALRALGSSRHTKDTDYLVSVPGAPLFTNADGIDYINAAATEPGADFYAAVLASLDGAEVATPQALAEMKAFALAQHCRNGHFAKADDAEFDITFLAREHGVTGCPIAERHLDAGAIAEIRRIFARVASR